MTIATPTKTEEKRTTVSKPVRFKNAVFSSMFVWILVIFVACDQVSRIFDKHESTGFSSKLINFFQSDRHPDILLIGSSLALSSSFESDSAIGILTDRAQHNNYYGAVQLQNAIESTTGKKLTAENLACFGAMTNHAWMIAEKLVEFHKTPKVLIYETASRDLFDASIPRSFQSEYYRTLAFLHPQSSGASNSPNSPNSPNFLNSMRSVLDSILQSHAVTLVQNLVSDPLTLKNPDRLRFEFDSAIGALVYAYRQRVDILATMTDAIARFFDRESSLQASAAKMEIENKKKNPFAQLSSRPQSTYVVDATPQIGRFEDEKGYFLKLLSVCKENNIRLIVVNMPVTPQYENLVPTELRPRWPKEAKEATEKYGFAFFDLNDKKVFSKGDFLDLAHLNRRGSLKLNDLISKEIAKRNLLSGL